MLHAGNEDLTQRIDSSGTTSEYIGDTNQKNLGPFVETLCSDLGGLLIGTSVGGTFSDLYKDYLHSTASAKTGSTTATTEYTPYGQVRTSSGTLPTDHQFQGQQNQAGVGLYHMGARWYDPTIGIWTQPDTIVPNPTDPLSLNRYAFVEGNPLKYIDPSGHCPMCVIAILTAPEWAPEVVAGAFLVAGALTVAVGEIQRQSPSSGGQTFTGPASAIDGAASDVDNVDTVQSSATLDRHLGGTYGDRKAAHHLIPDKYANHPAIERARALGWDIDGKGNGILLPESADAPTADELPVHAGRHRQWNTRVQAQLDEIEQQGQEEHWADDDPRWREAIEALDKKLLDDIKKEPAGQPLQEPKLKRG